MRLLSRLLPLALAAVTLVAGSLKTQGDVMAQKVEKGGWRIIGPGGGGAQFRPTVSPNIVLVACDIPGSYLTRDGGSTWRQFNLRTSVDAFDFDPKDPKVMYAGSSGLFRSEDGGEKWRLVFPSPSAVTAERMVGDHAQHSSDDCGRHWRHLGGYNFKWGHRPVPDPHRKGMLYLTTFGSSVWPGPTDGAGVAFEDVYPLK